MLNLDRKRPSRLMFAVAFTLTLAAQSSRAQQPAATLEEVIVTAQKREENAQSVPISITAISAESLQSKGLSTVTELSDFAPNVQMDNTSPFAGSSQVLSAYIRGIGQNDFAF